MAGTQKDKLQSKRHLPLESHNRGEEQYFLVDQHVQMVTVHVAMVPDLAWDCGQEAA